jgi:hypothetical protein
MMFPNPRKYDCIVVEKQNERMAAQRRMVHVSYALFQYFLSRNPNTHLISANTKFTLPPSMFWGRFTPKSFISAAPLVKTKKRKRPKMTSKEKKAAYAARKSYCIDVARSFRDLVASDTEGNQRWGQRLEAGDKTDSDAADALLLALAGLL